MSIKLTDTQLVMLSIAAQRDDRCLIPSKNLKGGAAQKVTAKLVAAGFAKEIKAKTGAPVWRRDEQTGQGYALKLTAAGAKVIAIDEGEGAGAGAAEVAEEGGLRESMIAIESSTLPRTPPETLTAGAAQILSAPRDGTKLAQVVEMLKDGQGATLAELVPLRGDLSRDAPVRGSRLDGIARVQRAGDFFAMDERAHVVRDADAEPVDACLRMSLGPGHAQDHV